MEILFLLASTAVIALVIRVSVMVDEWKEDDLSELEIHTIKNGEFID